MNANLFDVVAASVGKDPWIKVGRGKTEPNEYSPEWLSLLTDENAVWEYG